MSFNTICNRIIVAKTAKNNKIIIRNDGVNWFIEFIKYSQKFKLINYNALQNKYIYCNKTSTDTCENCFTAHDDHGILYHFSLSNIGESL